MNKRLLFVVSLLIFSIKPNYAQVKGLPLYRNNLKGKIARILYTSYQIKGTMIDTTNLDTTIYDINGNLIATGFSSTNMGPRYYDHATYSYILDTINKLLYVKAAQKSGVYTYVYNSDGYLTELILPNGTKHIYKYDKLHRNCQVTINTVTQIYSYKLDKDQLVTYEEMKNPIKLIINNRYDNFDSQGNWTTCTSEKTSEGFNISTGKFGSYTNTTITKRNITYYP